MTNLISTARLQIILEKINHIPHHVFLLILEYGVERMPSHMIEFIPRCFVLSQYYFLHQEFTRHHLADNYVSFGDILQEKCMDHEQSLKVLSKCRCCKRHQINKPVDLNHYSLGNEIIQSLGHYEYEDKQVLLNYICNCPCRHYARWIVRIFH